MGIPKRHPHSNIMSLNTNPDLKLYYSISEVATLFGVAESLLRFWEKQFPNIHPKKSSNNVRQYTKEDIEEIRAKSAPQFERARIFS